MGTTLPGAHGLVLPPSIFLKKLGPNFDSSRTELVIFQIYICFDLGMAHTKIDGTSFFELPAMRSID